MENDKRKRYKVNGFIFLYDPDDPLLPKDAKLLEEAKPKKKAAKAKNKALEPENK